MRASRGMGCINPKKVPGYKSGGKVKKQPEVNREISIDRMSKQPKAAESLGKKLAKWHNLGNLSAFK